MKHSLASKGIRSKTRQGNFNFRAKGTEIIESNVGKDTQLAVFYFIDSSIPFVNIKVKNEDVEIKNRKTGEVLEMNILDAGDYIDINNFDLTQDNIMLSLDVVRAIKEFADKYDVEIYVKNVYNDSFWEDMDFRNLSANEFIYINEEKEETIYEDVEQELYADDYYTRAYGKRRKKND